MELFLVIFIPRNFETYSFAKGEGEGEGEGEGRYWWIFKEK